MLEAVIDKALKNQEDRHQHEISRLVQVIGGLEDKVDLLLDPTGADRDVRSFVSRAFLGQFLTCTRYSRASTMSPVPHRRTFLPSPSLKRLN